ncbi:FTH domain-containing protein [Caenorhabditis elegans]|uniref:FTH domain-containing protein n=1 Tax=Caenorhabditis elegans TaxID=6239 RepID=O01487_CAEEL|nr:FTH domain-containing protein [Caenorhabditis elegans]CCD63116.1 FTH domain-containing protein [Caenorhabditis elegans]|eukprot:NP_504830.1 Uncharacterized protein CELE_C13F10.6 [Caenorhabditis elegans]
MKIIEFVERFKDRNSLELSSRRLRELCLKTPISGNFAIRLEEDPNWPSILTLLMRPRNFSSRLSVRNCSDVPEDERSEIVGYNYKDTIQNPDVFFNGVSKRLLNRIVEFEIRCRRFTVQILDNIEKFPKLNRIIVRNARNFSFELDEESGDAAVLDRIESLELHLDRQWCTEIERMKRLINPNLKHFCCHVNPSLSKNSWFIEEIMVEMALHEVQLETCQLVFPDPQMPRNLIIALTQFMSDRSRVLQVFITNGPYNLSPTRKMIPTLNIQFRDEEDNTVKDLADACPSIFKKAEVIHMTNLHEDGFIQLETVLPIMYSVKELLISSCPQKEEICPIDQILAFIPSTVRTLYLNDCKLTPSSIDLLISRCSTTLRNLHFHNNGSCNTVQNFTKLLDGLQELRILELDMLIPHLLFPKIVEHQKLEKLIGLVNGTLPENSLEILRQHFNHVNLKKIDRQKHQLTVSNPSHH